MKNVIVSVVLALLLAACETPDSSVSFAISLLESDELVLADAHIAEYRVQSHTLVLTPEGVDRWESLMAKDATREPPFPRLGGLEGKEFSLSIHGEEMYRGHFWSRSMSMMRTGILIYDTMGLMNGELHIRVERLGGASMEDPRNRPEVLSYFRESGKLR